MRGIRQRINSLRSSNVAVAGAGFVLSDKNEKVKEFPLLHHFKGSPTTHILRFKNGALHKSGLGLSFWFRQLNTSIAEVPMDDQELPFLFTSRSNDFQEVTVQGVITYRVAAPTVIASRIDFTIELRNGRYLVDPKNKIESFLVQLAQETTTSYLTTNSIDLLLQEGVIQARDHIALGFANKAEAINNLGLEVISVSVAAVKPRADVEKAMQVPAFEALQEKSDQATFARRAQAVEKERQIQENELKNRVALAVTQALLIAQEGDNARKTQDEQAAAQLIATKAAAERLDISAKSHALAVVAEGEGAALALKSVLDVYAGADQKALNAATFREFATNLASLQTLNITPDLLNQIANQLEAQ